MAVRYSRVGAFPRILMLLLLIAFLVFGALLWFSYLGVIDIENIVSPVLTALRIGGEARVVYNDDDIMLMDRLRVQKLQEAVDLRFAELEADVQALDERRQQLDEQERLLTRRVGEVNELEISLNERLKLYDNRRRVLEQNSRDLTSMRPEDAVEILAGYDDQLLIDTLRVTEELAQEEESISLVSIWLSQLPAERVADIQRKMILKPSQ